MKTNNNKANWTKPEVKILNIKKDTFSGSNPGQEKSDITNKN